MVPSLLLLSCDSSVSVKENPDRKKKKKLSATGLTNFKRDNLKTFKESLLRISQSSLFHSVIVEGKKEFLKKLLLVLILDILSI